MHPATTRDRSKGAWQQTQYLEISNETRLWLDEPTVSETLQTSSVVFEVTGKGSIQVQLQDTGRMLSQSHPTYPVKKEFSGSLTGFGFMMHP